MRTPTDVGWLSEARAEDQVTSDDGARVAVVTGAARGIGAAIASRLAADGRTVAVIDVDVAGGKETAKAIEVAGGHAAAYAADVADAEQVSTAIEQVATELGPPTILVNNAGVIRDNLLHKMSVADWDTVIGVHLRGAFLMSRAVQVHQVQAGWGRTVNLSSVAAGGNRGQANYSAAKAGLQGFTKTLAIELGRFGVTVNAIAPGFIVTDMTRATAERTGVSFEEMQRNAAKRIPVNRVGRPEDVAALVSFLTGPESGFLTGQVISLTGGPFG